MTISGSGRVMASSSRPGPSSWCREGLVLRDGESVRGGTIPRRLQPRRIDPFSRPGSVTTVVSTLGGVRLRDRRSTARASGRRTMVGSVSIATPGPTIPWTVTTVDDGVLRSPSAPSTTDGNIWVMDGVGGEGGPALDSPEAQRRGAILQSVTVGRSPQFPPSTVRPLGPQLRDPQVTVVRAFNERSFSV